MVHKYPIKNSSQSTLNCSPLRELVVALDEQNEELLLGGTSTPGVIYAPGGNIVLAVPGSPHRGTGMIGKVTVEKAEG